MARCTASRRVKRLSAYAVRAEKTSKRIRMERSLLALCSEGVSRGWKCCDLRSHFEQTLVDVGNSRVVRWDDAKHHLQPKIVAGPVTISARIGSNPSFSTLRRISAKYCFSAAETSGAAMANSAMLAN